jgi:cephalosporin hydroxylase
MYDISRIDLIKDSRIEDLLEPDYLEKFLIPHLGLFKLKYIYPEYFFTFCNQGLHCLQYPNQFNKYLIYISKYKIETYLEIGVEHGGTFITTLEYLSRMNNNVKFAMAADIIKMTELLSDYSKINDNFNYLQLSSQTPEFREILKSKPPFDLVLIDGEHSYEGCLNDFETVKDLANIIVFHDIVCSLICPHVSKVWQKIKETPGYNNNFSFYEITDQYQETVERFNGRTFGGFGIMIKKDFEQNNRLSDKKDSGQKVILPEDNYIGSGFYKLGLARFEKGDYQNSMNYFIKSRKLNYNNPDVVLKLSECLENLGNPKVAQYYFDKYQSMKKADS